MEPAVAVAPFKLVVIGASAGGLNALAELLRHLPATFPLPIVVVQHLDPHHASSLASILGRRSTIRVKSAENGETPQTGVVYIAPPDRHLLINSLGGFDLNVAPPVHFLRPSVDRLFATAAEQLGPVIGVILSGAGSDGAVGARAINSHRGVVIVEDAATAAFSGMPQAAIDTGIADYVVPLSEIPSLLVRLTSGTADE